MNELNKNENKAVEKKVETKINEVIINEEKMVLDEDSSFLTTDLTMTIQGYSYGSRFDDSDEVYAYVEDRSCFQVQTIVWDDEKGEFEKFTLKINKRLSESELEVLKHKTYFFKKVNVYTNKKQRKNYYGVDDLGEEIKSEDVVFNPNSYAVIKLANLVTPQKSVDKKRGMKTVKVKVDKNETLCQAIIQQGTRIDLKNISIKEVNKSDLEHLKGKEIVIENIKVFKPQNGSATYSTETIPKVK